jgi:ligand-binding SRPBCC domain-containing protein
MSNTQIITKEIYKVDENGQTVLIETIEIEVNEPTQEEIIAEKQAELLKIYAEIQALKTN